jgi:hypothetical protein
VDAPLIATSARKRGIRDDDTIHALNRPIVVDDSMTASRCSSAPIPPVARSKSVSSTLRLTDRYPHRARSTKVPEVPAMPRTAQEILDCADELAARFEQHEPGDDVRDADALRTVRDAFMARADAERALLDTVVRARHDGHSWASIGAMVGTSGEAARQRYGRSVNAR